jgi:hypothetical protein
MRWQAGIVGWLATTGLAVGQPPADVPPLGLPTAVEVIGLPNGADVSRPLQTVLPSADPPLPLPTAVEAPAPECVYGPLGRSWSVYEYLLWWPKASPAVGGDALDPSPLSGGRFTLGGSADDSDTVGTEVTYLFTGSRTATTTSARFADGRPVERSTTSLTNRLTGWEINGMANLVAGPDLRVHGLVGYRYFMANEGLRLDRMTWRPDEMVGAADQIDAHNRFHGGQLGLFGDYSRGAVFLEAVGKVALGQATNVARASGQSVGVSPGYPVPGVRVTQDGVLGRAAYPVRVVHSGFAVLPEATVKLGCRMRDRSRVYLGYNFLYLSEAARAGDQVETPTAVDRSDFWVQGLLFGLEHRY